MEQVNRSVLRKIYTKREPWIHKGQMGRLLVVAGSEMYTGSPILNGLAALRAGCDLVYLAAPKRAADAASKYLAEFITIPLESDRLLPKHVPKILELQKRMDAMCIGSGLGAAPDTRKAILEIIKQTPSSFPMAIDADAIRALDGHSPLIENKRAILTPHANEFQQLTGALVGDNIEDRVRAVRSQARILNTTILLKGHVDVISDGQRVISNSSGDVRMTKGGFGDTLTGICGAYLARNTDPFTAAAAAAFVNGVAGSLAARERGEAVLPSDGIWKLHEAIQF